MNRIFHARILMGHYLSLVLFTVLGLYGFLERNALWALAGMLLLVLLIERLIHTTYTLTAQGSLVIDRGRFSKQKSIPLTEIHGVEQTSSMRIGGRSLMHCVVLTYGNNCHEALIPVNEEEFISQLQKRRETLRSSTSEPVSD